MCLGDIHLDPWDPLGVVGLAYKLGMDGKLGGV